MNNTGTEKGSIMR